jgi:hypothetical protein
MQMGNRSLAPWPAIGAGAVAAYVAVSPAAAAAQTPSEIAAQLDQLQEELKAQRELIAAQAARIEAQERELEALKSVLQDPLLADVRGAGQAQSPGQPAVLSGPPLPDRPVGEAPAPTEIEEARIEAIPQEQGVLTPAGTFIFDPSIEYTRSSTNRLVFRGIELIPGIQVGLIEATDADRDTIAGSAALRYGLTSRIELEARIPFLYRQDRIEVVQQRDEGIVRQIGLREQGIGDVEFEVRYQLNRPRPRRPIWIAGLRVKTDTGKSPFEIEFDEFGVATGLATGSGFWGIRPGINFLLPSDPVVIYGGASYLYHIPRDINRTIGDAFIGRVDPGDALSLNLGFGFALNPAFSYSLGYRHSYIFKTKTEIGTNVEKSNSLHVGSLNFGLSYRLTPKRTINFGFEFGVTSDAPDVSVTVRLPIRFGRGG